MDPWAYHHGGQLNFIRPGKPVENGFIESVNGRLRDECLNVETFFTLEDVPRRSPTGSRTTIWFGLIAH
jgi:putative transposase